jgi:lysophospholipase L1-like esterase
MERREILIANNRDQSKYRIVTDATTLGELQDAIARNEGVYKMVGQSWVSNPTPINISGLTFTEGITKTQLLQRDSALPTNVQFKGQTTNNLVMLLTNTTKQIRSGAYPTNRKEFGEYIKKNNLGEAIKQEFGDNWTRISTDKLLNFFANTADKNTASNKDAINEVREELKDQEMVKEVVNTPVQEETKPKKKLSDIKEAPHAATVEWFYDGIKKMAADNLLYAEDVVVLADLTSELAARLIESKPKITASDMDDMLYSIRH